jgi:hypothetical protein
MNKNSDISGIAIKEKLESSMLRSQLERGGLAHPLNGSHHEMENINEIQIKN